MSAAALPPNALQYLIDGVVVVAMMISRMGRMTRVEMYIRAQRLLREARSAKANMRS